MCLALKIADFTIHQRWLPRSKIAGCYREIGTQAWCTWHEKQTLRTVTRPEYKAGDGRGRGATPADSKWLLCES